MKRFLSLLLSVCLLTAGALPAAIAAGRFTDITDPETQRAAELLNNLGIITGSGEDKYNPDGTFTRAMLAVLAVKLSGINDVSSYAGTVRFPDVRAGYWAHPWIMAAVQLGIITGGSSGNYEPAAPMRYSYLTTVLMRLLGYTDEDVGLNWPQSYITKAEALGLSKGMKFSQNDVLTRGQVARLIYNFLYMESKEGMVYIEESFKTELIPDVLLSFEVSTGNTVITVGQKSYTYRGALDASLRGKLASLLVDGDGNVLTITPDETASYKTVTVSEKRTSGLTLSDGSNVPIPSLGVWEWDGDLVSFGDAEFWENEPVTLVYRGSVLVCILRDSYENQIGAQFVKTILRLSTAANGQTYALAEDGAQYPVKGTIDPALSGRTGNLMIDREGYAVSFTASGSYTYQSITVGTAQNNGFTASGETGKFVPVSQTLTVWGETKETYDDIWESLHSGDVLLVAYDDYGRIAYIYRSLTRGSGAYALAILEEQPQNGSKTITDLFGEAADGAVLYKNGVRAEPDMLDKWDVLQYYETAGIIEASSIRLTGQYSNPEPNPTTPTKITLLNQAFDLLPEATQNMAAFRAGQRLAYLLTADGKIADVRDSSEVSDTTLGLADTDTVTINGSIRFTGTLVGFETMYQGKLCIFSGTTAGISVTPINLSGDVTGTLDLTAMTLGSAPIAPWCVFFDQVGSEGQGVFVTLDDITATRINPANILYARVSPSGYVTTVILNNMTGDAYKYGYLTSKTVSDTTSDGGSLPYMTVTVDNGITPITDTLFAGDMEYVGSRPLVGVAQGFALNGEPSLLDLVTCKQYRNITRFDFDGDRFVTLNGTQVPIADGLQVFIPATKEYMTLASARAYCKSFEVYTDPWGYKARFITGIV